MLGTLTTSIIRFAGAHPDPAYGLVLLAALAEALPVIGAFVPGDVIILGVSALVPTGALRLWPLVAAATVGAVLGDGLSYGFGARYRHTILSRWPLKRYPSLIARGEAFQRRHGGKSVFVARFTPGVRAIVPLLGGVLQMSVGRFFAMNVLSAIVWAPAHVLAGVAIGASFVLLGAVAGRLALIVALLLVLLVALVWGTRALVRRLPARAARLQERLWRWARSRESWLTRPLLSILDPARKELPGLALLGALLVASVWLFLGVLQDVLTGDPLVRANQAVFHFLQSLRTEWFDHVMVVVTELGDAQVVIAVGLALVLWFALRRNWRGAAHAAGVVGLSIALTLLVDALPHVAQVNPLDLRRSAFAFPGGHSAANAALYGFLAMVVAWELPTRWKLLAVSLVAILVAAIAFSRVYLGARWLSGVLAGIAFGTAWAAFLAIAYLRRNPPPVRAGGLCAFAGTVLLVVGVAHVEHSYGADMRRYAVQEHTQAMSWARWWRSGWSELAARRLNLLGEERAPLTFQWAGSDVRLARDLAAHGWSAPVPWTPRSALAWLRPHVRLASLPVLPRLENGRPQALVRILPLAGGAGTSRLVLRLWKSNLRLTTPGGTTVPVFVGTVQEQHIEPSNLLLTLTRSIPDYDRGLDALAAAIPTSQLVRRQVPGRAPGWDGRVLLGFDVGTR